MRTKWFLAALIGVSLLLGRSDGIAQQQQGQSAQNAQDNDSAAGRDFPPGEGARIIKGFQVAPVPLNLDMTDRDLRAIYEYLRAIPSLPSNP